VKKLMNATRTPENLAKGLLRARYDLSVFKDGTLRFDLTDIPLTHFRPDEVFVSVEKLRALGYTHDTFGEPLTRPNQMLELKVLDVILPEDCGDYLLKASKFLETSCATSTSLNPTTTRRAGTISLVVCFWGSRLTPPPPSLGA
jgi:DNA polymerase II large subunit